jgi:hypothetical protein
LAYPGDEREHVTPPAGQAKRRGIVRDADLKKSPLSYD